MAISRKVLFSKIELHSSMAYNFIEDVPKPIPEIIIKINPG